MENHSIGSFIAILRKANGMTQKEFAEKLMVTDKTVSRWERDESAPDITLIPIIAEIFGVSCEELLKGKRLNQEKNSENALPDSSIKIHALKKKTAFLITAIISSLIIALGLFAAIICNFVCFKAHLGFILLCVFLSVAAVVNTVSLIKTKTDVKLMMYQSQEGTSVKSLDELYDFIRLTSEKIYVAIAAVLVFGLPLIMR